MKYTIPFNKPYMSGRELHYISEAHLHGMLAGDGEFTMRCQQWLKNNMDVISALLTHSCTAALEMSALLLNIRAGDEIIMPSYTFVSTANAFVLRGGVPVFVDIREDTLNIDEKKIENAITRKTKAIVPVHYAGMACEMDSIVEIANEYKLKVVEDAAQALMSTYKGRNLGSIGDLGAFSFHETKNIISGEGGALLVNNPEYVQQAEIIREKGTNRSQFFRGEVDKYTWQGVGSSFLPGEIIAAFLWAQIEDVEKITRMRLECWNKYHSLLESLEKKGLLRRPIIPNECTHNAHMYYVLLPPEIDRHKLIGKLKGEGIHSVFHYVPLHSSPAGRQFGRVESPLRVTELLAERLLRLPLWIGLDSSQQEKVVGALQQFIPESY